MSEAHDLFFSYRRKDRESVEALLAALQAKELRVWLDRNEIENAASIQRRIDEGFTCSRAFVAWYTVDYPKSRTCQWELTAALIAAGAETAPVWRLLVVNPEENTSHIEPVSVRDLQHFSFNDDYQALAHSIANAIRPISGTLGALRRLTKPDWFGLRGLGSNRFVGRVTDVWKIHSALCAGDFAIVSGMPVPAAAGELAQIRGSGGIGKSLLAEEYALRFGAWWPGGIFWLRAYGNSDNPSETEAELAEKRQLAYGSQLADFALQLGLDVRDKGERELRAACRRLGYGPFLSRQERPDKDALALAAELAPQLPNGHNPRIAATFLGSIRHLDENGRDVLRLAAQLAPAPIPVPLLEASLAEADQKDEEAAKEIAALALQQVLDHSLAEEAEGGAYTVHGLVVHTLRRSDNQPDRGEILRQTAMAALLGQMAEAAADICSHVRLAPFIPHAQELARDAEDPISLDLAGWLGTFYHEAGLYQTAREWNEAASHRQMALLDEEHPDTLFSMNNLALTLRAQGDIAGARSLQEKVLKARRRLLGEKHPDTSASAWSLLMTLAELGDTSAALALLKSDLLWLLERHPNELGGTQRNIRKLLADGLKTG